MMISVRTPHVKKAEDETDTSETYSKFNENSEDVTGDRGKACRHDGEKFRLGHYLKIRPDKKGCFWLEHRKGRETIKY
ncbi:hypothetical protein CHS0354_007553 [Potamilus streckersoni]|uniref:Uncharacterized protein n=1 Tax=Potamilus streckersoni TaxID=2493646 RepID=A0AAE0W7M7_9BIVA|nr:hypothetical protein CHS0354_007553 [Potamilus streckersoni]